MVASTHSPRRSRILPSYGWLLAAMLTATTAVGCSRTVHMDQTVVPQPTAQMPPAISVPLYIVHDINKVPPALLATGEGAKDVEVHGLPTFLTRDVVQTLRRVFTHVDVIQPGAVLGGIYLWLDVQIHWIRLERQSDGSVRPLMNWTLTMYAAGKTAYVWRQNSTSTGPAGGDVEASIAGMFSEALAKMQASYARQDVYSRLQRLEQSIAHAASIQAAANGQPQPAQ